MKYRLITIVLIVAVIFTCGCFEQPESLYIQDKYATDTFGGSQRYWVVSGSNTYECADVSIYEAPDKGSTYKVVISANNKITKVVT